MSEILVEEQKPRPFLRWTGSKTWFVKEYCDNLRKLNFNDYHELFLGGGSVFFNIQPKNQSFLYDLNDELINTYLELRDNPDAVIFALRRFKNSEEEYYKVRAMKCRTNYTKAARFIFLNKTSFNGIYRVNSKGNYNVPYGKREKVDILNLENLLLVSKELKKATIINSDFETSLQSIKKNDLIYIDPPYTVAHENNGFIEYNSKLFSWEDQRRLLELIQTIDEIGAYYILSNAEHYSIRDLYKETGEIFATSRYSKVGGRLKTRGMFNEVIITNIKDVNW